MSRIVLVILSSYRIPTDLSNECQFSTLDPIAPSNRRTFNVVDSQRTAANTISFLSFRLS